MPTFKAELARMLWLQHENKISDDEPCRVVLPRIEAQEKIKNPKGQTRFILECDTEDMFARFLTQKDRWIGLAINKSIALDSMCRVLEEVSDQAIQEFCEGR